MGTTVAYACESPEEGLVEGDLERTCMGAFNWSGLEPVCGGCPIPISDRNYTTLVRDQSFVYTYPVGHTVTYECANSRLVHVAGDLTRTCLTDLTWSGLQPRCGGCPFPPHGNQSIHDLIDNGDPFAVGDTVSYQCLPGLLSTNGDTIRTCLADRTWSGTPLSCSGCSPPANDAQSLSLYEPVKEEYQLSEIISYSCIGSYVPIQGEITRTCGSNLEWTGNGSLLCAGCPPPENGTLATYSALNVTHYEIGYVVEYMCLDGFVWVEGVLNFTCMPSLNWNSTAPTCKGCDAPENGALAKPFDLGSVFRVGETVRYSCTDGFFFFSGDMNRTCLDSLTWSGVAPECRGCTLPEIGYLSNYSLSEGPYYPLGQVVKYTCQEGFLAKNGSRNRTCIMGSDFVGPNCSCTNMSNDNENEFCPIVSTNQTIHCAERAVWSETPLQCGGCKPPFNKRRTVIMPQKNTYRIGESVNYTCKAGFQHTLGDLTRYCQESLTWSGRTPTCAGCSAPDDADTRATYSPALEPMHMYSVNETITYSCDQNFVKVNGSDMRTCQFDLTWSGYPMRCGGCGLPELGANSTHSFAHYNVTSVFEIGTVVTYECLKGHGKIGGDWNRTCLWTLDWSGDPLVCSESTTGPSTDVTFTSTSSASVSLCDEPPIIPHTKGTLVDSDIGTAPTDRVAIFRCDVGFWFQENRTYERHVMCSHWHTVSPCTAVQCPPPPESGSAILLRQTQDQYEFNSTVEYRCPNGTYLPDGRRSRFSRCTQRGVWSAFPPTCTESTTGPSTDVTFTSTSSASVSLCDEPPIIPHTKGTLVDSDIGTAPTDRVAIFRCDVGYWFQENRTFERHVMCSHWHTVSPCTAVQCPPPPQSGSVILLRHTQEQYVFNSTVEYRCPNGTYLPDGRRSRFSRCTQRGVWSAFPPTCTGLYRSPT
ncbi:sushi, von Willebrand factor type A, EGF and pentraxin domain-containing protein 1-like [Lingula anatina]|uniref:Sushi, von Willebrand factor type A, EGF and pentraxin domain-containing protein 1-like n=1 Tax=Lingula anatina TaxID=7574 RepID=A0A1S3H4J8_LINAN|nr:sushi, von Willebrand factor type A, EGF and pentraxin domain-containing protein 1-like [Lingula anatina]|eukprot:XP_013380391.1 sushi, von Willebrand factor type A, EGF and pentraxin domain-containing protein 1-like [Lingula anatina]